MEKNVWANSIKRAEQIPTYFINVYGDFMKKGRPLKSIDIEIIPKEKYVKFNKNAARFLIRTKDIGTINIAFLKPITKQQYDKLIAAQ